MPLLDEKAICSLKRIMGQRFGELVTTFESDASRRLTLIGNAYFDRHMTTIMTEVHGLKGSCRNIGAELTATLCQELEQHAREEAIDQIPAVICALQQDVAAIAAELKAWL